ncbi:MAG: cysteine desulfurase [Eggerthellaceae bacterium]|nr:cysteine desulfurase [Eggerthellaceae bacterium]
MATKPYTYLDYAATCPLCEEASVAMAPYLVSGLPEDGFIDANANALYSAGRTAFHALEEARATVARAVGARPDEIIFTSCSSEADNAAVVGIAHAADASRHLRDKGRTPRIIISATEHDAVLNPAKRLQHEGFELVILPVERDGRVSADALRQALTADAVLVSIQMANGEIGSVQDVEELARISHAYGALFHTDATQALGKLPVSLHGLGVDAASFSAHKVGGPKGVGFLYLRARTPFEALVLGGGQESGRRSGTQNVMGAVGCAAAVKAAVALQADESLRLIALRDRLYAELTSYESVHATLDVPAGSDAFLPNIVNLHVDGYEGPTLVLRFNNEGFYVSAGSACSSGSLDPSRALTALGIPRDAAQGEFRISMGRYTTDADIDALLAVFPKVIGENYGR